jgi:alkane 1-monooxygenase
MKMKKEGLPGILFLQYLPAFFPSAVVLVGNLAGGFFSAGNMVFTLVLLVLVDFLVPAESKKNPEIAAGWPDFWLLLAVLVHLLGLGSLFYGIQSGKLEGAWVWTAAISTGLNAGLLGLNTAHELIHRKSRLMKFAGMVNLFTCLYSHFYIEHRLGHHARVGTAADPATARRGEGFYSFLLRTIPGQWSSAFDIEKRRFCYGMKNFVLRTSLLQVLVLMLIALFSLKVLMAYLLCCAIGIFLLEYVNYIEHYGLVREKGEKLSVLHAWQSDSQTSRFSLFELSRHSHHHLQAQVPYQNLESMESPHRLPFGYFGMFYIALCPPLWFRVMDRRIQHKENHHENFVA